MTAFLSIDAYAISICDRGTVMHIKMHYFNDIGGNTANTHNSSTLLLIILTIMPLIL